MKISVVCDYCGKEFLREKSRTTTHCSKRCAAYTRNKKNKITTTCKCCGKEFTKKKSSKTVHCSRNCAATVSSNKMRLTNVAQFFKEQGCKLLDEYKNVDIPMVYRCSCGNVSKIKFTHFKSGIRCMKCSGKRKSTFNEVKQFFKEQGCELLENEYKDSYTKMKYKCECGRVSSIAYNNFKRGTRCINCAYDALTGPNNPRYDPNLTDQDRKERTRSREYKEWRRVVYHKNDYTCQKCHQKGGILNAHHVMNYASFPEHRLNPDNGITFCKSCHIKFHSKYGNADNNEQQLKEYLSI